MEFTGSKPRRLLLHACCGPCSLMPVASLRERGIEPAIFFSNSNITPEDEYTRRLQTIASWAESAGVELIEDVYEPACWKQSMRDLAERRYNLDDADREERCRACYRFRFDRAAEYARDHGYGALGSTLSVSPYQFTDAIREELERACESYGLDCAFEDYRPLYGQAETKARELGLYRQNYCGCANSIAEADEERERQRIVRRRERDEYLAEHAEERAAEEARLEARRKELKAYKEKQLHQKEVLRRLRMEQKQKQRQRPAK